MSGLAGQERRREPRHDVRIEVDWRSQDNFLFATITDISSMGIFVATPAPASVGSRLVLRFSPPTGDGDGSERSAEELPIEVRGEVVWTTSSGGDKGHPGMGICFVDVEPAARSRILDLVRAVAYLDGGR
jgi:type IV pilus assembly protein PilZ